MRHNAGHQPATSDYADEDDDDDDERDVDAFLESLDLSRTPASLPLVPFANQGSGGVAAAVAVNADANPAAAVNVNVNACFY